MEKCWEKVIIRIKYNRVTAVIVSNLKVYCMGGGREFKRGAYVHLLANSY